MATKKKLSIKGLTGKRVVVRTYSAGVHFGTLVEHKGKEVLLKDSRRIWYWSGACSLSQVATEGSKSLSSCKIAVSVPELYLSEAIELLPMSKAANEQLTGAPEWKS